MEIKYLESTEIDYQRGFLAALKMVKEWDVAGVNISPHTIFDRLKYSINLIERFNNTKATTVGNIK